MGDEQQLAISTRGLRKVYRTKQGKSVGVQGLDLDVPVGGVHGFLGPNGSGKTTTIRMLLGLIRPDAGTATVFGHDVLRNLPDVIDRIGAIVESPKFYPAFSGRRNLELLATAIGAPRAEVDRVLAEVGLTDRAKDKFRGYSLGMKQRLAIAATLLKDPDLLIFDEPTNGLDPAGIKEIRRTMRSLADAGKTVLVSSHILGEVEQVADTVTIVSRGSLVAQGKVSDLIGASTQSVRLRVADLSAAAFALSEAGYAVREDVGMLVADGVDLPEDVTRVLADRGMYVSELVPVRADLESVFLDLTGDDGPGATHEVEFAGVRQPGTEGGETA